MLKLTKLFKLESVLVYLLFATLLAVPLYPKFPLFFVPGLTVAIRLEDLLIFTTFGLWSALNIKNIKVYIKDPIFFSFFVFFLITLFSVFSAVYLTKTAELTTALLHWGRRVQYISLFFVARTVVNSEERRSLIIKGIFIVVIYAFFYGIGQKFFDLPVITTQNSEYAKGQALFYLPGGHLVSTFAGHYDLASVLILFAPIMYLVLFSKSKNFKSIFSNDNLLLRLIVISSIFTGLWLLVNAASRISIVSYMFVSVFALFLVKKYKYIPVVIISILIFINFSSNLISRYTSIFNVIWDKVSIVEEKLISVYASSGQVLGVEDRSTSIRLNIEWPRAIRAFSKNVFLGTGFSSITLATDNDYLRSMGETGLFGSFALGYVFLYIIWGLINYLKSKKGLHKIFVAGAFAALPGIFVNMIFIDILEASKFAILFWLILGIALAKNFKYEK